MRLNLYTTQPQEAEQFLIENISHECEGTFSTPRTLNGQTVYVCSWELPEEEAAIISAIMPDIIKEIENFDNFGYLND